MCYVWQFFAIDTVNAACVCSAEARELVIDSQIAVSLSA